jgi:IS30 family transposase
MWRLSFSFGGHTRLDNIAQAAADHAATIINGQRRRHLNYQSPTMLYTAATATVQ